MDSAWPPHIPAVSSPLNKYNTISPFMITAVSNANAKLHLAADDFHIFIVIRKFFPIYREIYRFLFSRFQEYPLKANKLFSRTYYR